MGQQSNVHSESQDEPAFHIVNELHVGIKRVA